VYAKIEKMPERVAFDLLFIAGGHYLIIMAKPSLQIPENRAYWFNV